MANKGRPKKVRYIQKMPGIVQFSPRGKPGRPDEIELTIDQFEAIKLADWQGFSQADGASAMRVSRSSFGRIIREARRRVADALASGKIIKIRMGDVQVGETRTEITHETIHDEVSRFKKRNKAIVDDIKKSNSAQVSARKSSEKSLIRSSKKASKKSA